MKIFPFDISWEWDDDLLTKLGFLKVPGHTRLLICPLCFSTVLADVAEKHWEYSHQTYHVYLVTPRPKGYIKLLGPTRQLQGEDEALRWIEEWPLDIVMIVDEPDSVYL